MFGTMPRANHHLPRDRTDPQRVAMLDPGIAERQRRNDPAEPGPAAFAGLRDLRFVPARTAPERDHLARHRIPRIGDQHPRGQPFAARHHQGATMRVAHPAGEPDMIGVEMRADHLRYPHARQRPLRQSLPRRARLGRVHAGIDQRHAARIVEQPAIDVLERPRDMQPHPADAGGHGHHRAGRWLGPAIRIGQPLVAGRDEALLDRNGRLCNGHVIG
ncbi:hypothetical protein D9M73_121090 [compost metagenome]